MMMMNLENTKKKERKKKKKRAEQSRADQVAESFLHLEKDENIFFLQPDFFFFLVSF